MTAASPYLMENVEEADRLEDKTDPAETRRQLRRVGMKKGMQVLDAGAGTGAVARVMARMVGPSGHATALDVSKERLDYGQWIAARGRIKNLAFVRGDLRAPKLPAESFDLVWCRFVFQYLEDPDHAMESLVRLARPGGKVVVGDVDGLGVFCDDLPQDLASMRDRFLESIKHRFDPFAGRKLYRRMAKAGLQNVAVHLLPHQMHTGVASDRDLRNWQSKFRILRELGIKVIGDAAAYDAFAEGYLEYLRNPSTFSYVVLFLVEGTKAC